MKSVRILNFLSITISGEYFLIKSCEISTQCIASGVKDKAQLLGFACLIMSMCRRYSLFQIATLKFWISPAIDHKQIAFFFDKKSTPIGYMTWAHLAHDSEERLIKDPNFLLHPSEWNEGGETWIIDFNFPRGCAIDAFKEIKEVFRRESIEKVYWVRRNEDYTVRKIASCCL
ncbi:cytolysin-activating lysine-acyltransferase [Pseudomonas sp. BS3782 TE3695]|uniref:toxin-activating lysine-acyltransferase n=1 Tax=Pseudomonas sp. BS3782 TE3695 TaxID=3349323 RepID=UPI003D24745A